MRDDDIGIPPGFIDQVVAEERAARKLLAMPGAFTLYVEGADEVTQRWLKEVERLVRARLEEEPDEVVIPSGFSYQKVLDRIGTEARDRLMQHARTAARCEAERRSASMSATLERLAIDRLSAAAEAALFTGPPPTSKPPQERFIEDWTHFHGSHEQAPLIDSARANENLSRPAKPRRRVRVSWGVVIGAVFLLWMVLMLTRRSFE